MGNIVLLDDLTINQIAAGEVIERPASVVKELVENSIDAGATVINVEIKNGGISYIRVSDNGKGFLPDDMEIAFERHATSKIRQATDLEIVKTMGFRGEALASIASISKVELVSRREESDIGYKICVEGGNIKNKIEAGCPKGSTITITDLFFNTPVRYKFLKKDFTEAGYIEDAITRVALANPQIAIKLINTGKTVIQTPGNGDRKSVIYSIFGKDIAENILEVDYQYDDIKVTGVVGKPIISRSNRANQMFFVNKRYVKDKTLTSAAEQAFKGMITIGKYGFVILNLDMNPEKVDVNVHPAKLEVRFEEDNKVFKAIYHAIKEALLKGDLVGNPDRTDELREETLLNNKTKTVQDPLSFRNATLIHGAAYDSLSYVEEQLLLELESSDDNPMVDIDNQRILSTPHFETLNVSLAIEMLNVALSHVSNASIQRMIKLGNPDFTGLSRFLIADEHQYFGLQALQKTAATLDVEIHHASQTLSNISYPLAGEMEDRQTNLPLILQELDGIVNKLHEILAIELLYATQAIAIRFPEERPLGLLTHEVFQIIFERYGTLQDHHMLYQVIRGISKDIGKICIRTLFTKDYVSA